MCPGPGLLIFASMNRKNILLAISLLSLISHLALLGGKSFWVDEAYAAGLMHLPPGQVAELASRSTPHPPGAFMLIRASAALAGTSEAGIRFLNALAVASGVIPAFFLAGRMLGKDRWGFLAAMIWVLSPYTVALGQEAWVYGLPAALAVWCLHLATLPFRRGGLVPVIWLLVCVAGLYTQFSFILVVFSSLGLMAARKGVPKQAWAGLVIALLLWTPLVIRHGPAMRVRSERLNRAGLGIDTAPSRLARSAPLALSGLLADGLVPRSYREIPLSPLGMAVFGGTLMLLTGAGISFALDKDVTRPEKIWAFVTAGAPFALFLVDAPGERQLFLAAVPLTLGLAALFKRLRWSALPSLAFLGGLLGYWYTLNTNAYHRSDWRGAAAHVGYHSRPGDVILVHSGQSGGIAWDLSGGDPDRIALGGDADPWSLDRPPSNPAATAESILSGGERLWLVADLWGEPPIPSGRTPRETIEFGRDMRVYLFTP